MTSTTGDEAALQRARSRLARSRSQWVAQMQESPSGFDSDTSATADGGLGDVLRAWWHRHPLKLVLDVIGPVLNQQARRHPTGLLALAALAGAALVLLRPWRALPLATWVALRSVPLDAWLTALRKVLRASAASRDDPRAPG
jgi:hypothetical protein